MQSRYGSVYGGWHLQPEHSGGCGCRMDKAIEHPQAPLHFVTLRLKVPPNINKLTPYPRHPPLLLWRKRGTGKCAEFGNLRPGREIKFFRKIQPRQCRCFS